MKFNIQYSSQAEKSLESLHPDLRLKILERIGELEVEPFPRGILKLKGERNTFRLRIGNYRILYRVYFREHVIVIARIEHRRSVYER